MKLMHLMATVTVLLGMPLSYSQERKFLIEADASVKKLASGMAFTEGPVWIPAKKMLVFSDIPNSRLMQWDEVGGLKEFRKSEQANGNILDLEGRLVSCQHAARNIIQIDSEGAVKVLADKYDGKRFNSPNDVAARSDGSLWFTDPPWGLKETEKHEIPGHWVYRLDSSGEVHPVIKDLAMPNGINFSPDESRLYVADTGGHKRHPDASFHGLPGGIHCYEVLADGSLGRKLFVIDHGSDGMTVDVEGNLYTTHDRKIMIHDAHGELIESIPLPENPANATFGGADYKTLFITAQTSLYSVRMKNAGAKPPKAKW